MKAAVIIFPGSNRERDVCAALKRASGREPAIVWHRESELPAADLIVLPGGFAHGDYLRCGAMAAHSPIMREVKARAAKGVPVLGICNGFQVLVEAGMLPGALLRNQTMFTCGYETGQTIRVPIAHGEGNYTADDATLDRLDGEGRVAFRYCSAAGELTDDDNVNGSVRCIAGVFNKTRTVLGLMPHPENVIDPLLGGTDGQGLFDGLVSALQ